MPEITSAIIVAIHCSLKFMLLATIAISTETTEPEKSISARTLSMAVISLSSKKAAI